jgi:predicted ArsR family transcriptional regulator
MDDRTADVAAVAALAEPTRRRLYDHVVRQSGPVSRDEASAATGVPRATAAFHLDRLVADGLLEVQFQRLSGRTGPGAGRPAKLYQRSECTVSVSLPERHYDLAGDLLATALDQAEASGEAPRRVLERSARRRGTELAQEAYAAGEGVPARDVVLQLLEAHGFEPRVDDDAVVLANCPFHTLALAHTDLVCGMNLSLLGGVLEGVPAAGLVAALQPETGRCCVRLRPAGNR